MKTILVFLMTVALAGCSNGQQKKMNVTAIFTNASVHPLDWVSLETSGGEMTAGVLPPGIDKSFSGMTWSRVPDQAKLTFIDEKTRQKYAIPVSLTNVNQQVRSGKCRTVVIRILDYDKAEIVCQ